MNFTKQDFIDAAEYMDKNGWFKKTYTSPMGEVCAVGAIVQVKGGYNVEVANKLSRLTMDVGIYTTDIFEFNDYVAESKEEVETLLLLLGEALFSN